jgi:hypothetical protein
MATINISIPANWRAQLPGLLASIALAVASWITSGNKLDYHNPLLWVAILNAIQSYYTKATNVTGGTTLQPGAVPDAALHAEAAQQAAAPK